MDRRLPYLFISYSHSDSVFANKFSKRLKKAGIDHFLDTDCVMWGDNIHNRIRKEFERVSHLVVLISPGSIDSQWVSYEMGYAHGCNIKLVPYLLHPNIKVPDFIRNLRYLATQKEEASFIESLKTINNTIAVLDKNTPINNNYLSSTEDYSGHCVLEVDQTIVDKFYLDGFIDIEKVIADHTTIPVNSFISIVDATNKSHSAIAQFKPDSLRLQPVYKVSREGIFGIYSRNREQSFALTLFNDDYIKLVTVIGNKHTEQMKLAVASAFQKVFKENKYQKIILSKSIKDKQAHETYLLPESTKPWMQSFVDVLESLMLGDNENFNTIGGYRELVRDGLLEITPLNEIVGRTIHNAYIIIDDSQLITIDDIKDLIFSVGEESKLVFVSNLPRLRPTDIDKYDSGIYYLISRLKGQKHYGHIILKNNNTENLYNIFGNLLF